jgi:methionyl-tRNA formyltransferase
MLAADTPRARAYIDLLNTSKYLPSKVVLVEIPSVPYSLSKNFTKLFDSQTPLALALERLEIPYKSIKADNINDEIVVDAVSKLEQEIIIFAGPGGAIVRSSLFLTGKEFIHIHPGKLPEYRGSTPMYYSILKGHGLMATAILLSEDIDAGAVLAERSFDLPSDLESIDHAFDPWMRATLLVDVIDLYVKQTKLNIIHENKDEGTIWHVIHPVLKTLSILNGKQK